MHELPESKVEISVRSDFCGKRSNTDSEEAANESYRKGRTLKRYWTEAEVSTKFHEFLLTKI